MARRNQYLDALRGIAVVFVLFFHLFPASLPGGYLGVDIFFVLAGYLAVQSLDKRSDSVAGLISYPLARLRRLAPAAFVVLITTVILAMLLIPGPDDFAMQAMHQAAMGLGFDDYLTKSGNAYFAPTEEFNPYLHLWTISVEIKYYALIFGVYVIAWLLAAWSDRLGAHQRALRVFLVIALVMVSLGWFMREQAAAYYLFGSRIWQFGLGSLLAFWLSSPRAESPLGSGRLAEIGRRAFRAGVLPLAVVMLVLGAVRFDASAGQVGAHLYTVFFALLAIHASVQAWPQSQADAVVPGRFAALIGLLASLGIISYSLYLVHWPVVVFARWSIGIDGPFRQILLLLLSFALGLLLYRTVEARTIGLRRAGLLGVAAFAAVLPYQLSSRYATRLPSPYLGARQFMPEDLGGSGYQDPLLEQAINGRCESEPADPTRSVGQVFGRCQVRFPGRPSIYLFGDSSAGILKKEFSRLSQAVRIGLSIHAVDGCFVPGLNVQTGCGSGLRAYLDFVRANWKPGDIVVASYNWMGWGSTADARQSAAALQRILERLPAGAPVFVLGPYPVWEVREPIRCFGNFGHVPRACQQSAAAVAAESRFFAEAIRAMRQDLARPIHYVDLVNTLCADGSCNVVSRDGSRLLYKDDGHLTNSGAGLVVQRLQLSASNSSSHWRSASGPTVGR
jgi:peptidoglycan/LPS O-acetylase OafA/YrhL